jgi:hypothetical protein
MNTPQFRSLVDGTNVRFMSVEARDDKVSVCTIGLWDLVLLSIIGATDSLTHFSHEFYSYYSITTVLTCNFTTKEPKALSSQPSLD